MSFPVSAHRSAYGPDDKFMEQNILRDNDRKQKLSAPKDNERREFQLAAEVNRRTKN